MKQLTIGLLALSIVLTGCTQSTTQSTNATVVPTKDTKNVEATETLYTPDLETIMSAIKTDFTTIQETRIYTEDTDPNGNLGKTGYYIAGAAFWDTRTGYSDDYATEKGMWGTEAGGSVEVYPDEADAKKRVDYLASFVGNPLTDPGAFKQIGNVVVRGSSKLTKNEQDELLDSLASEIK